MGRANRRLRTRRRPIAATARKFARTPLAATTPVSPRDRRASGPRFAAPCIASVPARAPPGETPPARFTAVLEASTLAPMLACVDVSYGETEAFSGCILFTEWTAETGNETLLVSTPIAAPYKPGEFYLR